MRGADLQDQRRLPYAVVVQIQIGQAAESACIGAFGIIYEKISAAYKHIRGYKPKSDVGDDHMAVLNIVKDGDEILRKKCRPVKEITPHIIRLLDDMQATLHKANGVGLAAPQVGVLRRMAIVECEEGELIELINPEIISKEGEQEEIEGCLTKTLLKERFELRECMIQYVGDFNKIKRALTDKLIA